MDKAELIRNSGILLLVITAAVSGTYTLTETGRTAVCDNGVGWVFQETGPNLGKYMCDTVTKQRYEYCSRLENTTAGKINYRCYLANAVLVETPVEVKEEFGTQIFCPSNGEACRGV